VKVRKAGAINYGQTRDVLVVEIGAGCYERSEGQGILVCRG
jgi:hypothetical protein